MSLSGLFSDGSCRSYLVDLNMFCGSDLHCVRNKQISICQLQKYIKYIIFAKARSWNVLCLKVQITKLMHISTTELSFFPHRLLRNTNSYIEVYPLDSYDTERNSSSCFR